MSFPKFSARALRDKYPEAENVIQVRIANREGDTISYEGVCPGDLKDIVLADLKDIVLAALFEQSVSDEARRTSGSERDGSREDWSGEEMRQATNAERGIAQAIADKLDGDVVGDAPDGWDLNLSDGWACLIATSGDRRVAIRIWTTELARAGEVKP